MAKIRIEVATGGWRLWGNGETIDEAYKDIIRALKEAADRRKEEEKELKDVLKELNERV